MSGALSQPRENEISTDRVANMYRHFALVAVIGSLTLALPTQAQQFSFSIGSGGYGHHHHGCYGGPCWGPWYGPGFGMVYAPPPRVVFVQPPARTTVIVPPAGSQVTTTTAAPANALAASGANDARITIRNASGARLPVNFLVDGQEVELADGQAQTFSGQARCAVQYDRGGRYGSTQQDLTAGIYDFRITPSGWDLVRQPDAPAVSRTPVRANSLPSQR